MPTIIDLGKQIKQQYPQYSDMSDEDVGKKVKMKDPAKYNSFSDISYKQNDIWGENNQNISTIKDNDKSLFDSVSIVDVVKGISKGIGSTAYGMGSLLEKSASKLTGQKTLSQTITGKENLEKPKYLTPQNTPEKVGYYTEQIAEFLAPSNISSKISGAIKVAKLLSKAPSIVKKATPLIGKMATEAGLVGGQTSIQQGELNDTSKVNALIAAAFPALGKIGTEIIGATGKKIQETVIKPSLNDIRNGFKIENISKYNLGGGLKTMLSKTTNKLNELSGQLKNNLKESNELIDLSEVYYDTASELLKNKTKNFGNIKSINRVLNQLADELDEVAPNLKADLLQATNIKRGAGTKGSWVYGSADPDATAVETVYNKFYNKLKIAIEKKGTDKIKTINKQLSELIPIQNAILRRIPIAERNNLLSLTDNVGMFAAVFDPRALALIGAKKLSMSGNFANVLLKANELIKNAPIGIGERLTK
jgi:hypothetical protein